MPIRINLKEIFPSDPQEITVDKVNFNFNKLLELGVGVPGPIGITGPQGPAGPIGLIGPQGDRGATWWVDSGDPNTITFTGLIDGDLYLDQTSTNFQIYQYDDSTSVWTPIVNIAAIVNSYLSSLSTVPFETVPTIQLPGTTTVNKFILFDQRAAGSDSVRGISNTSLNNMLFLNNFDETDTVFKLPVPGPINTELGQDQYNSLLAIYPDHSDAILSSNAEIGRYHIELGSLYTPDLINKYYSNTKNNLKIKFYKRDVTNTGAYYPLTNSWINTAKLSLSVTETQSIADIDENAEFEFLIPKLNKEGIPIVREELAIRFSSAESIVEQGPTFTHIVADGIHLAINPSPTNPSNLNATLGLALDFVSTNAKLSNKTHFMLDANSGVNGMIILNKGTYVSGDMNIVSGVAVGNSYKALTAPSNGAIFEGNVGINTPSPVAKLHVKGQTRITDGASIGSTYYNISAPASGAIIEGNVGIGVSTPTYKLQINDSSSGDLVGISTSSASAFNRLFFEKPSQKWSVGQINDNKFVIANETSASYRMLFETGPNGNIILSPGTGNVGINATSPTAKLQIDGTFRLNSAPVADSFLRGDASGNGTWSAITNIGVPVGAIMPYFGNTAPTGWLLCDGLAVFQFQYPSLYNHLVANGQPSFTIPLFGPYASTPNLRDLFIVGAGASYALRATGGDNAVSLTRQQLAKHTHKLDGDGAVMSNPGDHTHPYQARDGEGHETGNATNNLGYQTYNTGGGGAHIHTGNTGDGTSNDVGLGGTGGNGAPHENRPPFYALTYIIKT